MKKRILVLGAGFGGLELCTMLSEAFGDAIEVTLIERTRDKYVPVKPRTLETRFPNVYAVGDCARQGTPKAGVFAEGAARAVARALTARLRDEEVPVTHAGTGSCYIEFGAGRIGRVDVDFFSNPDHPVGTYYEPSVADRKS